MPRLAKRRALTPVLATVILIAMTLISAISIGGFVFGLFGTFTSTAQVQAQFNSCASSGDTCVLTLYNSGSANTDISTGASCLVVTYDGQSVPATSCSGGSGVVVRAGGSLTLTANFASDFSATPGQTVTGQTTLTNGAVVLFSGTFS